MHCKSVDLCTVKLVYLMLNKCKAITYFMTVTTHQRFFRHELQFYIVPELSDCISLLCSVCRQLQLVQVEWRWSLRLWSVPRWLSAQRCQDLRWYDITLFMPYVSNILLKVSLIE